MFIIDDILIQGDIPPGSIIIEYQIKFLNRHLSTCWLIFFVGNFPFIYNIYPFYNIWLLRVLEWATYHNIHKKRENVYTFLANNWTITNIYNIFLIHADWL